jgi:hypothetical protein
VELYILIIRYLLDKELFNKYFKFLDTEFLRRNFPEVGKIVQTLEIAHNHHDKTLSLGDLEAAFYKAYPKADTEIFVPLFSRIANTEADSKFVVEYLDSLVQRQKATELAFLALDVAEGKGDFTRLQSLAKDYSEFKSLQEVEEQQEEFVDDDLEVLYKNAVSEGGLRWRLKSLNRALGPLRRGDFGFIFARPETGKTTFLASEFTYMAMQTEGPILWFNNEERGDKVLLRCYEASLGVPLDKVLSNKPAAREEYYKRTKRNIRLIDSANIDRRRVEVLCKKWKPSLILFDQLDKVKGFNADRDDLELGAIYQWARELAKEYCPTVGVSQAGGDAEGVKFLTMGHVSNAKTAKQAEADWILGIGYDYRDLPNVRGFSLCKNKLIGGEESVPELRHGKWEVMLEPSIGRYKDLAVT